jgi:hypothetical protein
MNSLGVILDFRLVGIEFWMLRQIISDDGQRLIARHPLVALAQFDFQRVEHIDVGGGIPARQNSKQTGANLAE